MTKPFWKPEPRQPLTDWRTYLIGVPVLSSALGACLFMALSFSFTELEAIPLRAKVGMVIVAAFATAMGSAFGSVGSGIEVYRKAFEGRAVWLDWVSLALSVAATLGGFVMGFAALLGAVEGWSALARVWGPLALSALVALDAAGDLIELGGLFAAYNMRYEQWLDERRQWDERHAQTEPQRADDANTGDDVSAWPVARLDQWRAIARSLNGSRAECDADAVRAALNEHHLHPPSDSTVNRWAQRARDGSL